MTMVFILYHQERSILNPLELFHCKLVDLGWPFSSRPDIWMQKRAHGYQVYEPTDGEDDYGEFYHYMKKRNGMSLASFFLPGDLDDMFE